MQSSFVIFAGPVPSIAEVTGTHCAVFPVEVAGGASMAQGAVAIARTLEQHHYRGQGVMLAVPSHWCLCAAISVSDLPRRNRRALLTYRLEEQLPMAAEELVIDFTSDSDQAMGVAVALQRLSPWVDALSGQGVHIQSISPAAILAAQNYLFNSAADGIDVLLWADGPTFEVFEFHGKTMVQWTSWSNLDAVMMQLRHVSLTRSSPLKLGTSGCSAQVLAALNAEPDWVLVNDLPQDPQSSLQLEGARCAHGVLCGEEIPVIELRRDALASGHPFRAVRWPLAAAISALVLFAFCLVASLLLRAQAYGRMSDRADIAQRAIYQQTLGAAPVGSNIKARLVSEDRRLSALSGTVSRTTNGEPAALAQPRSALLMLADTLKSLPGDIRFRVLDLALSPQGMQLQGEARSHGDADALVNGLRGIGGYAVDPPHSQTRSDGGGVAFTITAQIIDAAQKSASPPAVAQRSNP